jgi:hypothetical protein
LNREKNEENHAKIERAVRHMEFEITEQLEKLRKMMISTI